MNDLRFALRQLLKKPGFTAVAVLTLAIGIGATSSVFSLVRGVLLTPPPYLKPEQIVFAMRLLAAFSVTAGILALVGIYGVTSLSIGSRRREIAIRLAVGAQRRDIRDLVLGDGFRVIGVGLLLGFVVALASTRVLASFLFGVDPHDPMTLVGMTVMFGAAGLWACWIPARRAAQVDPMEALRTE